MSHRSGILFIYVIRKDRIPDGEKNTRAHTPSANKKTTFF